MLRACASWRHMNSRSHAQWVCPHHAGLRLCDSRERPERVQGEVDVEGRPLTDERIRLGADTT